MNEKKEGKKRKEITQREKERNNIKSAGQSFALYLYMNNLSSIYTSGDTKRLLSFFVLLFTLVPLNQ